jgi:hypothetical protein
MTEAEAVVHVALPDADVAACAATTGLVLDWEEAHSSTGQHFTCVQCHRVLTADRTHVEPPP